MATGDPSLPEWPASFSAAETCTSVLRGCGVPIRSASTRRSCRFPVASDAYAQAAIRSAPCCWPTEWHTKFACQFISFIERSQQDVVERILRHCGLWEGPIRTLASARAPPHIVERNSFRLPPTRHSVPDPEFLESEYLDRQTDAARELQLVLDPDFL